MFHKVWKELNKIKMLMRFFQKFSPVRPYLIQELDIRNSLLMTFEDVQRLFCISEVIIMDTMISRAKGQMITWTGVEFHTADIGFSLQTGHRVLNIGWPITSYHMFSRILIARKSALKWHNYQMFWSPIIVLSKQIIGDQNIR